LKLESRFRSGCTFHFAVQAQGWVQYYVRLAQDLAVFTTRVTRTPTEQQFRCQYVTRFIRVVKTYELNLTDEKFTRFERLREQKC